MVVDEYQRTTVDGIFALGDVSSPYQLKHVANHEARVVAHNLAHPDDPMAVDHRFVPAAVFTDPQIASVGLTEQQAEARGIRHVVERAAVLRHRGGLGARGHDGLLQAARRSRDRAAARRAHHRAGGGHHHPAADPGDAFGQTARDMARGQYWIHPALPELVENALLALGL